MRTRAIGIFVALLIAGCGGDDGGPEADASLPDADLPDASLTERMQATLAGETLCPGGYTMSLEAVASETSVTVQAQCSESAVNVLLRFAPVPEPGGEVATCFEATFRNAEGEQSNCRVNSDVNAAPTGEAQLNSSGSFLGSCDCGGEGGMGAAVFQLTLQ